MTEIVQQPKDSSPRAYGEHLKTLFNSAVKSGLPTIIVHPYYPFGYGSIYAEVIASLSDDELFDSLSLAAEMKVALEITTAFLPQTEVQNGKTVPLWSIETPLRVLSLAKKAGCKFSFGSDAHSLDAMTAIHKLEVFSNHLQLSKEDIVTIP